MIYHIRTKSQPFYTGKPFFILVLSIVGTLIKATISSDSQLGSDSKKSEDPILFKALKLETRCLMQCSILSKPHFYSGFCWGRNLVYSRLYWQVCSILPYVTNSPTQTEFDNWYHIHYPSLMNTCDAIFYRQSVFPLNLTHKHSSNSTGKIIKVEIFKIEQL